MQNSLLTAVASFLKDAPSTPFQVGYLTALVDLAEENGLKQDQTVTEARAMLDDIREDVRS